MQQGKNISVEISKFEVENSVNEYHVMIHVENPMLTFAEQASAVSDAFADAASELGAKPVFKRYFLSDSATQTDALFAIAEKQSECAVSVVEQPPLNGTKVALWAYLQTDVEVESAGNGMFVAKHGDFKHIWSGYNYSDGKDSEEQTRTLLIDYVAQLQKLGCSLSDDCIRTWFFVHDIDNNYGGVVKARNEVFKTQNLTSDTHYISSTGIGGRHANHKVLVELDHYAVSGLEKGQINFLYAPTHLNPTYEYGVAFERGTYVDYADRRHVFISGTASINNKGEVVHVGNIVKQVERMWENVDALLKEADCTFDDLGQMIVYLRDMADYAVVKRMFDERFPSTPKVITLAPVCRPGWLIEMECMGAKRQTNKSFKAY
ncbi:MAG: hypothetical protein II834_02515 [Bacteroidaceae bacterium]|nr:hypothetical protein [Bacteroidaceae bacterium]